MSLSLTNYNTYISKKPSERYLDNDGQLLIELLEKNLKVKFTTTPNDTKLLKANGSCLFETGPFQADGLEIFVGYQGHTNFTKLISADYSLFKYPDGTIKGFEVFKSQTYPYIEMQTTYSRPLVPNDMGGLLYKIKGTSGYDGIPEEVKNAFFGLFELLDRAFENNKNTEGRGIVKSLSSDGKSISYDDGGLSNMLTTVASIDPVRSNMVKDLINQYGLKPQLALI